MKGKVKRWTVMLLTGVIVMAYAPVGIHAASIAPDADVETIAVPIYNWGFKNNEVEGSTVANSVYPNNSEGKAELHAGASVVQDEERGRVLSLPGGQAAGSGYRYRSQSEINLQPLRFLMEALRAFLVNCSCQPTPVSDAARRRFFGRLGLLGDAPLLRLCC